MIELPSVFKYHIRYAMVHVDSDEPQHAGVCLNVTPDFCGYNTHVLDDCVVMDLSVLLHILKMCGTEKHYLLTCECGDAEDVGIMSPASITVTATEIYVDFSVDDYLDILVPEYTEQKGETLRIVFNKNQYEATVLELMQILKKLYLEGVVIDSLTERDFTRAYGSWQTLQELRRQWPGMQKLEISSINPFDADVEELLEE